MPLGSRGHGIPGSRGLGMGDLASYFIGVEGNGGWADPWGPELGEEICRPRLLGPALIQARLGVGTKVPSKNLALWGAPQEWIG